MAILLFLAGLIIGLAFGCGVTLWWLLEIKLDEIEAIRRGDD